MRVTILLKLLIYIGIAIMIIGIMHPHKKFEHKKDEKYIRDRIVKITNSEGQCSGVIVKANSGKNYILTAAHCALLFKDAPATVEFEDKVVSKEMIIKEDERSDLLIVSLSRDIDGLKIADKIKVYEHVHSSTHGLGMPTYRTDGDYIGDRLIEVPLGPADTIEQVLGCVSPKQKVHDFVFYGMPIRVCFMSTVQQITTAHIVPGSSGGAMLNDAQELVGIVSTSEGDMFGNTVTLHDIQEFMRDR